MARIKGVGAVSPAVKKKGHVAGLGVVAILEELFEM
jgi:hypothetical protein